MVRRRKVWIISGSTLLLLFLFAIGSAAWYYSSEIHSGAFELDHSPPEFGLEIVSIDDDRVTLAQAKGGARLDEPGSLGLWNGSDYGAVGDITSVTRSSVVRSYQPFEGELSVGDRVKYEKAAFPSDPLRAFGLAFDEVMIDAPLGEMPAWVVPGASGDWAIMVHGKSSSKIETLRALRIAAEADLSVMAISYRNSEGLASDPSGEYRYGITEWEDLDAAVRYALDSGAERIVLFGLSMGGAIVANFMIESDLAGEISGLVLDAPLLNLASAVDLGATRRGVPEPLPFLAKTLSTARWGVDWSELDTREELGTMELPILLFHGSSDKTIPVSQSDEFARDNPDNVTYVRVDGAEHVGSWNIDPAAYRDHVLGWLSGVGTGG